MTPAGGAFGAAGVVDADGAVAPHVMIEPDGAVGPAGETVTPGGERPGDGTGETTGGAGPAAGQPGAGPAKNPAVKPAATSPKTTVTKTTVSKTTKPKTHYGNNAGASQDRRRLLDSCLLNAIPAGDSASERRISLLMRCNALDCDTRAL